MLKLVAPISMDSQAQLAWIATAVDSLEGIQAAEVAALSLELRRSITRPAQIVPEIARLVSERRKSKNRAAAEPFNPLAGIERQITEEAQNRRGKARNQNETEAAWKWERDERLRVGLDVPRLEKPLTAAEIARLDGPTIRLGIKTGALVDRGGQIVDSLA